MKLKRVSLPLIGETGIVWEVRAGKPVVTRIMISGAVSSDCPAGSCAEVDAVAGLIRMSLEGHAVQFPLSLMALDRCPAFQQSVLRATAHIPRGRVSTYQLIARAAGHPRASRAAGNALADNPFPLIIPCHRVIRSDGQPGGYAGGPEMKTILLGIEGVSLGSLRPAAPWSGP